MVARWRAAFEVIGRGTMQRYKGQAADPRDVGRDLGVAHVLSGRVRREGERVRIAVELVDAASGKVLWARPVRRRTAANCPARWATSPAASRRR